MAWSPSGKARVCKTLIAGSIPAQASNMRESLEVAKTKRLFRVRCHIATKEEESVEVDLSEKALTIM